MLNVDKLACVNLNAHISIILYSEGGLLVCVCGGGGGISEGDANFLWGMNLVSPKDLGFQRAQSVKVSETLDARSL